MQFRRKMTDTCCRTQKNDADKHFNRFKKRMKKPYIYVLNKPLMKKILTLVLFALIFIHYSYCQNIKSPSEFFGYELGSRFTFHHQAVEYFKYVADASPLVEYVSYGATYEGRPLGVCFISSEENLKNLEEYRKNNLVKAGFLKAEFTGKQLPFVWLSYNVHGNESAGMETAMKTLYTLATGTYEGVSEWLKTCIIVIDPCQNPDGRDMYAFRYSSRMNLKPNPDRNGWEHREGWPNSRTNHYMFDLNRDWNWQTQVETRQRLAFYARYMPQVHADFHEMGPESTFFFAPGAEPWHEVITPWQHEFHKLMGAGNAKLFDEKYRLYYTKENFDLFSPSYGDTWPTFNGAVGFTYEQGGGGFTGIALKLESEDTLTLSKRIEGHFLASMATIKVSYENREKLVSEFNKYFDEAVHKPQFQYKSVIIKGNNESSDLKDLLQMLDRNQVRYSYASGIGKKFRGFDYMNSKDGEVTVETGDILVSAIQPQSRMVKVMFEPKSVASDSLSYDLTAWALPYAYNLKAFAVTDEIKAADDSVKIRVTVNQPATGKPYAYLADFTGFDQLKLMAALYTRDIKVRYTFKPTEIGANKFNRGSLIIARGDNLKLGDSFDRLVTEAANLTGVKLFAETTGLAENGKDLGSNFSPVVKKPVVGLLLGDDTQSSIAGEIWFYFERELNYPITLINTDYVQRIDLRKYDVLILPGGSFSQLADTLLAFARSGGRVIAIDNAVAAFAKNKSTALYKAVDLRNTEQKAAEKKDKSDDPRFLKKYELDVERRYDLSNRSEESIYKVRLDETNPYVFGLGTDWFVIKRNNGYPYLQNGYNFGYIQESDPVSGFAGNKFREKVKNTMELGSEKIGAGEIIYLTDDPYFRAYWKSGRILLGNAILR
jgi:hypothetical protein